MRSRSRRPSKYASRPRGHDFMTFVRRQPCVISLAFERLWRAAGIATGVQRLVHLRCRGRIEANHSGERIAGLSTKALDRTCIAMCNGHHGQWTEYRGIFADLTHDQRRAIAAEAVALTHLHAESQGIEVPAC